MLAMTASFKRLISLLLICMTPGQNTHNPSQGAGSAASTIPSKLDICTSLRCAVCQPEDSCNGCAFGSIFGGEVDSFARLPHCYNHPKDGLLPKKQGTPLTPTSAAAGSPRRPPLILHRPVWGTQQRFTLLASRKMFCG